MVENCESCLLEFPATRILFCSVNSPKTKNNYFAIMWQRKASNPHIWEGGIRGGLFKISALKMNSLITSTIIADYFQVWQNNSVILTALPVTLKGKVDNLYIINSCLQVKEKLQFEAKQLTYGKGCSLGHTLCNTSDPESAFYWHYYYWNLTVQD